jgi:MurNAc alpha-1-phosphate uridylyltransferase
MIFAAGFGTRMAPLTATMPKPLIPVAGKPLIDHALALTSGIPRVVVNLHYKGEMLADHLAGRGVALSWERDLILDTGGGLRHALPLLGGGPVFTLNSDAVWTGANPLRELAAAWDATRMDCLLLLLPAGQATGHDGRSDFVLAPDGRIERAAGRQGHVYLGAQIVDPAGLSAIPDRVFSLNRLWDAAIARGRAFGVEHQGGWCDVGHPGGIALAEAMLHG